MLETVMFTVQVMTSFWLYNAFQPPVPSPQFFKYAGLLGESEIPGETVSVELPSRGQSKSHRASASFIY